MRLPRKQISDQADWLDAYDLARAAPDRAHADWLVSEAAYRLRARLGTSRRAAFGWSGGKDSLALEIVARRAALDECVLVISGLEWPAFLTWATDNMPWGLTIECRTDLDLPWLVKHPAMLFPDGDHAARWFALVQHTGQRAYAANCRLDLLVLGRRRADGNFMGEAIEPGGYQYRDKGGFDRYSPIGDWSHEDVLTVLAAHEIDLPPCYSWPRGFRVGTGPWPARQWTTSPAHGWSEVVEIDPTVARLAAPHFPAARHALDLAGA